MFPNHLQWTKSMRLLRRTILPLSRKNSNNNDYSRTPCQQQLYTYTAMPSQRFRENIVTMLGEYVYFLKVDNGFFCPSKILDYECDDIYHQSSTNDMTAS